MITREALRIAHEKATFLSTIDRSYDDSFAKAGGKIGASLRIRMPNQFTRTKGSRVMDIQDVENKNETVTVATQDHVDMRFNSAERALSLDDFSRLYIEPAISTLISGIEADVLVDLTKKTPMLVGTPGTVVGASDIAALGAARAKLNQQLAPKDGGRACQLDSITMASVATKINNLFHPASQIEQAFREGFIARTQMADFYENERTYSHTTGADVSGTVNDLAIADGVSTLTMASFTPVVGDVFTIADCYDVHPETKQAYSHLKQFVVTAVDGNDITFYPPAQYAGPYQNVNSLPVTGKAVTAVGSAATAYRQNLMYHKDFAAFVTADLPIMPGGECARRVSEGLSMRVWTDGDIRNDEALTRIDILYGWKFLRPWAVRITN
jgi:hypothetical protein